MGYKVLGTKVVSPYPVNLTPGERRLVFVLEKIFAPERILVDCYFPKVDLKLGSCKVATKSDLAQIDCLVVDESGVYVFESKDYVGWIYAHGGRTHWTQVSGYGKNKHQFYSPIRQNAVHADAVQAIVGKKTPVVSVIVFGREATLKVVEGVPSDCMVCTQNEIRQVMTRAREKVVLESDSVEGILEVLRQGLICPDGIVRTGHVEEVAEILRKKV